MHSSAIVRQAFLQHTVVPAFNIPYLPMLKPIVQAVCDMDSVAMIQVARLEWEKFEAVSLERVAEEYGHYAREGYTLLHLDHVPVIDEDHEAVDFAAILRRAVRAGYQSMMVDGSRLSLAENIQKTREGAEIAHAAGLPIEAELGAVMGHESGARAPYEEVFAKKLGFTDVDEATRFVQESQCDWLSVAVGSVHGAIAENLRDQKKPTARLDIERIRELREALDIPLVLHGGSGIDGAYIARGIQNGIAKINVGTELRQPYEQAMREKNDVEYAREKVYLRACDLIENFLKTKDDRDSLSR